MSYENLISALLFMLASGAVAYAVIFWWFLSDLPAVLTQLLWRTRLIPDSEKWKPAGPEFYETWSRKDWDFWMHAIVSLNVGFWRGLCVKMLTCPPCFSFHAGCVGGAVVWLTVFRTFESLPFIVLGAPAGAAALRFVPFPEVRKAAQQAKPSKSDRRWAAMGLEVGTDGKVKSAVPALAMIAEFFNFETPCFFEGCEDLRAKYKEEHEKLESTGCTACDYSALQARFVTLVEKTMGTVSLTPTAEVKMPRIPDAEAAVEYMKKFFDAEAEDPCKTAECAEYRKQCLSELNDVRDPASREGYKNHRMKKVLSLLNHE